MPKSMYAIEATAAAAACFVATELSLSTHFYPLIFYSNALPYFVIISFLLFGISVGVLRSFGAKSRWTAFVVLRTIVLADCWNEYRFE